MEYIGFKHERRKEERKRRKTGVRARGGVYTLGNLQVDGLGLHERNGVGGGDGRVEGMDGWTGWTGGKISDGLLWATG